MRGDLPEFIEPTQRRLKTCARCMVIKRDSMFARQATSKDGLGSYCRECQKAQARRWRHTNADHVRQYTARRRAQLREERVNDATAHDCGP
jgi:hypothetical protein